MNILYTQYIYPILNCVCGIGVIYLYSCSQNNISKLKNTISSLTEEVLLLNKQLDTEQKKYLKNIEEIEQFYETKLTNLNNKIGKIANEDPSFLKSIEMVINDNSLSIEDKINECKILLEYIIS